MSSPIVVFATSSWYPGTVEPIEPRDVEAGAQRLRGAFQRLIRRSGLLDLSRTPCGQPVAVSHAHALMELMRCPGMTQGELACTLGLSKSALSRLAAALERRGWIQRRSDDEDRRIRRLTLTARGREVAGRVDQASLVRFAAILEGIPPETREQVLEVLELLRQAIPAPAEEEVRR